MTRTVRWGIAGTGGIATLMADTMRHIEGVELVAVGSQDAERARSRFDPPMPCGYDQLWDSPCDVIYIATPASHHYRHALAALNAGKHVLVEKPFTVNATQANLLRVLADASDLFLMEAAWQRFTPAWARLRSLIDEHPVGDIQAIQASFGGRADYRPELRPFRNDLAGGALMDGGVYPIHLAHMLFGAPDRVQATATMLPSGVDGDTAVSLGYQDGPVAALLTSITTNLHAFARLSGTDGTVHINANFISPAFIQIERANQAPETFDFQMDRPRLAYEVDEVHRCIEAGYTNSPVMTAAESCAIMATLDAARRDIGLQFSAEAEAI